MMPPPLAFHWTAGNPLTLFSFEYDFFPQKSCLKSSLLILPPLTAQQQLQQQQQQQQYQPQQQ